MRKTIALAATAALTPAVLAALPAAAHAQASTQFVGDPVSYVRQGLPRTQLRVAFRLNEPLAPGAQVTVQTTGGTVLGTDGPAPFGTTGNPCYRSTVNLSQPASQGGVLVVALTTAQGQVLRNFEAIATYTVRQERRIGPRLGCS